MSGGAPLLAGVELGGTKCVCLIGTGPDDVRAQVSIATGSEPRVTLDRIAQTLQEWRRAHGRPAALGIASFGPVDLELRASRYGFITSTSKQGWRSVDVVGPLTRVLGAPTRFDTDVNGAALAEGRWGAARELANYAYVTVGTGVGVGVVVAGQPVRGFSHPELGHIRIVRHVGDDWQGCCPFHGDCVEGLASGTAIEARTRMPAAALPPGHPAWQLVVHALGQLLHTLVLTTAPQRILLGGGVMTGQQHLFARLQRELQRSLNHYIEAPELDAQIASYLCAPALGERAGPLGALALAADALAAG